MSDVIVSVCIPVYKSENTIKSTIESVLAQSYKQLEIIVVDNCSPDKTWCIISDFTDSRIKKYRNSTNIGMRGNWNKCLEYATGKYVHFLCGDDIILPECIEKKVLLAERDEAISLVFSASEVINAEDKVVLTRRQFKADCIVDGKKLAKKSFLTKNLYGEPSNVLFRRSLLNKTGVFAYNLFYTLDWEMWMRLSVLGKVGFIADSLMKYRISKSNGTNQLTKKAIRADDILFIENIENAGIHFSKLQKIRHRIVMMFRMNIRKIFMDIRS